MDFFEVIGLEQAVQRLQQKFPAADIKTEQVPLMDGQYRFLAEDIIAAAYVPDFDRSTVDGYAALRRLQRYRQHTLHIHPP